MTHLRELRTISVLRWVSSDFVRNHLGSSIKSPFGPSGLFQIVQSPSLYSTERTVHNGKSNDSYRTSSSNDKNGSRVSGASRREAQDALLEYLHSTRSIQFLDAENMSKNSPHFLNKLLKNVKNDEDIGRSVARFLRYHPINEFEPFFESIGLEPLEYSPLLPRNKMFLSDDDLLVQNYHALCSYGIDRNKIGKVYKEAAEIFRFNHGVLQSKLQAYEDLGIGKSIVAKVIVSSPYLLTGDVSSEFVKVLEILKNVGIDFSWMEAHLSGKNSCNWMRVLRVLRLLFKMDFNDEQLGGLISQHPGLIFDGSGDRTLSLIGLLWKFGSSMHQIRSSLLQLPDIPVQRFLLNFSQCFMFLNEIGMHVDEIGKIVRSHSLMLGSCNLKKTSSLLVSLNIGPRRLCKIVQENPEELRKWVKGWRVGPLPSEETTESYMFKTKFLLDLGFEENSKQMERLLRIIRSKGTELQERCDCILNGGLDKNDVCQMIQTAPNILRQSKNLIEKKIDLLVNELGYPISALVPFPSFLSYEIKRIKLRLSMYNWLKDRGRVRRKMALSTIVSSSDKVFELTFVNRHPKGFQVWQDLKKQIYSE